MVHDLYENPGLYDQIVRPGPCEQFYSELARQAGGPVLELACGTGRLTVPIASTGVQVTGLDASAAMLSLARRKAAEAGRAIQFVRGDMREFDLGQTFNLIIVSCNSFGHLVEAQEMRAALRAIRGHLAPGGVLAFDVVNPRVDWLLGVDVQGHDRASEFSTTAIEGCLGYDHVTQVASLQWLIRDPGPTHQEVRFDLRVFFPQELRMLLEVSGFRLAHRFGDFSRGRLDHASLVQVCIAEANSEQDQR